MDGMRVAAIGAGKAVLRLASAYEATVTLVPEPGPELVLARYSASASQHQRSASDQPSVLARFSPSEALSTTRRFCNSPNMCQNMGEPS